MAVRAARDGCALGAGQRLDDDASDNRDMGARGIPGWHRLEDEVGDSGRSTRQTPGGYHSFDHRWALGSAFELHASLGKARVHARIHQLNSQLKDGLRRIKGVRLHTPMSEVLSSGIVCFDVATYRHRRS